jgi:hypothetical protein
MVATGAAVDIDLCFSGLDGWPLELAFRQQSAAARQRLKRVIEYMRAAAWCVAIVKQLLAGDTRAAALFLAAEVGSIVLLVLAHLPQQHPR